MHNDFKELLNIIDVEAKEILEPKTKAAPSSDDRFITGSFSNSSGQRNYKLYIPPNAGTKPLPLVVMLHGCTQNADDFAAGTAMNKAAQAQGFYVLYPIQSQKINPQKCWSWFKHTDQQAGQGEPAILAGMTREVINTHTIDNQRVYVAGLSAGGAMATILSSAYPELYAAAGVHSGLAAGAASDLPSALSAMQGNSTQASIQKGNGVPTIVFHGDRDTTVHLNNAQAVIATSVGSTAPFTTINVADTKHKRHSTKRLYKNSANEVIVEYWEIHGAGHAWAGGSQSGSYTDPSGPDATAEMLRFFFKK